MEINKEVLENIISRMFNRRLVVITYTQPDEPAGIMGELTIDLHTSDRNDGLEFNERVYTNLYARTLTRGDIFQRTVEDLITWNFEHFKEKLNETNS